VAKMNPEIMKRAHAAAGALTGGLAKTSFVPGGEYKAAQGGPPPPGGMPPGPPPPGGGAPPGMDPAMMGGAPGMPPPPGGMLPPGGPMPPGMDPMAGGMPPGGPGGAPPVEGQPITMSMEDLVALFEQIQGQEGTGEGDNEPTTTNVKLGEKMERIEGKMDEIASMLGQLMGVGGEGGSPPGEAGAMPPGMEGGMPPPELMAALGGGGMSPGMAPEGVPMDPAMAGGMPSPMVPGGGMPPGGPPPGMPPGGGMMPQAGAKDDSGITKRSAMAIGALAAKLRKR